MAEKHFEIYKAVKEDEILFGLRRVKTAIFVANENGSGNLSNPVNFVSESVLDVGKSISKAVGLDDEVVIDLKDPENGVGVIYGGEIYPEPANFQKIDELRFYNGLVNEAKKNKYPGQSK